MVKPATVQTPNLIDSATSDASFPARLVNLPLPGARRRCPVLHNNGIVGAVKMQLVHSRHPRVGEEAV
jgi:hypothetical protein